MTAHLTEFASAQQQDGGWPITWQPPGVVAELTWRGVTTVAAVRTLTAYSARRPGR